jgi:hypothetical protein
MPTWWGKPVLTRAFLNRVVRWLAAFAVIAVVTSAILGTVVRHGHTASTLFEYAQLAVIIFSILVFPGAWLLGVFFWFRAFANSWLMMAKQRGGLVGENFEVFWNPLYGLRHRDLFPDGLRNRSLMLEGILGFLLCCGAIFAVVGLTKLVGIR